MRVSPYLNFGGRCEEAIDFYVGAVGAEVVDKTRFSDIPEPPPPGMLEPGFETKIMHSSLRIGDTMVMMTDGGCTRAEGRFEGISLAAQTKDAAEAERVFAALSDGGRVEMPLGPTFFSERFGVVADRFGVNWMVVVAAA